MNHLALITSLKVSGNFGKIAGNFPEFYSDGVVNRVYNVTQLTGYLYFGFVYANVSIETHLVQTACSAAVNAAVTDWLRSAVGASLIVDPFSILR
jgi:hypothetical protein